MLNTSPLNVSQFFSSLVNQYVGRYNRIADQFGAPTAPASSVNSPSKDVSSQPSIVAPRQDKAELAQAPKLESPLTDTSRAKQDSFEPQKPADGRAVTIPVPSEETEASEQPTTNPDSPTYTNSFTNLRYGLKLEFDMQAIERTVRQLSVRQTSDKTTTDESFEHMFSGGFGFSADLKLSGISVNATAISGERGAENYRNQETGHQARKLQSEAAETGKSLPAEDRQNYQVAVNRFSLRYKTDTKFSTNHFSRFQSHVEQLNGSQPESVGAYAQQAGQLAQNAPNEVVGQFFDTVDGYLQNQEESLIANAERFFDMAGESLGLSAEAVESAKATVTNTIGSFFDSVGKNLSGLKSQFDPVQQPAPIAEPAPPLPQAPSSIDGSNLSRLAPAPPAEGHSLLEDLVSALEPDEESRSRELLVESVEARSKEKLKVSARDSTSESHKSHGK